jgi:hypothetical protein
MNYLKGTWDAVPGDVLRCRYLARTVRVLYLGKSHKLK